MSGWETLKVTELKEELKSRGIPLTGLKLKQQLIDKLVEVESQAKESANADEDQSAPAEDDANAVDREHGPQDGEDNAAKTSRTNGHAQNNDQSLKEQAMPMPAILGDEESHATDNATLPPPVDAGVTSDAEARRDDPSIPENNVGDPDQTEFTQEATIVSAGAELQAALPDAAESAVDGVASTEEDIEMKDEPVQASTAEEQREATMRESLDKFEATQAISHSTSDDQRKRKRDSDSPSGQTESLAQKKVKTDDGKEGMTRKASDALARIQEATNAAELSRQPNDSIEEEPLQPMEASSDPQKTKVAQEVGGLPDAPELQQQTSIDREPSDTSMPPQEVEAVPDRDVAPARHPITSSIYIKNFKRPLHIPSLREHVSRLARSSSGSASDKDPIKVFYLDSIRTHAFISFSSVAEASRVRNAMHETRFPDEPMREPLWIDFIPDEDVQHWIDEQTGGEGRGFATGRGGGRKFEVVYDETRDGTKAVLQQINNSTTSRPGISQQRSDLISRDNRSTPASASGVHPDRASMIPREPRALASRTAGAATNTTRTATGAPPTSKSDVGTGFKALDELFQSTTVKPKLYFKLQPQSIIDDRLDMIRDLRVGHSDMGRSGDEGMKRYTFEDYKGREEWVDKGPEFGFGRKGQDRLTGFRGRGGGGGGGGGYFRGGAGGGRRGGGGGDSWRGR